MPTNMSTPRAYINTEVWKWVVKTDAEIEQRNEAASWKQWMKAEIQAVQSLIEFAHRERLVICKEVESVLELGWSTNSATLKHINSLLGNVRLYPVSSPFKHARILAGLTEISPGKMREDMLDFAINNYSRMRQIWEAIGDGKKKADAYHIWTAETSNIEFFVTLDKKLVNSARNQRRINFGTQITYPSDLKALLQQKADNTLQ